MANQGRARRTFWLAIMAAPRSTPLQANCHRVHDASVFSALIPRKTITRQASQKRVDNRSGRNSRVEVKKISVFIRNNVAINPTNALCHNFPSQNVSKRIAPVKSHMVRRAKKIKAKASRTDVSRWKYSRKEAK